VFAPSAAPSFTFGDLHVAESEKLLRTARDFSDRSLRFESCQYRAFVKIMALKKRSSSFLDELYS
jgi:hypothetical protein